MRTETEMYNLILGTATADERIRAVILNGSRANPRARKDPFQDFDIVYLVTDVKPFREDMNWIDRFGERMILQLPDDVDGLQQAEHDPITYLIQFMDGNRIDLTLIPVERLNMMEEDSLTIALLDKDGILPAYPPPDDSSTLPQPPTEFQFDNCCNEFWWVSAYVAKGLWRGELIFARSLLEEVMRKELMKMMTWYHGVRTGFHNNPGKYGKYLQADIEPELWEMLLATFRDDTIEHTWQSLFVMGELFRMVGLRVGDHFGYTYPADDDRRVSAHLQHVYRLPPDAADIYPNR